MAKTITTVVPLVSLPQAATTPETPSTLTPEELALLVAGWSETSSVPPVTGRASTTSRGEMHTAFDPHEVSLANLQPFTVTKKGDKHTYLTVKAPAPRKAVILVDLGNGISRAFMVRGLTTRVDLAFLADVQATPIEPADLPSQSES